MMATFNGTDGDDLLTGTAGADSLRGGLGNDTYVVNDAGDSVEEVAAPSADSRLTDRGVVIRASTSATGAEGNNTSFGASLSGDGTKVAFVSYAGNLVGDDGNNTGDIFVKDLVTGAIMRASTSADGGEADSFSEGAVLSADGTKVAFVSYASNLVPDDTNGAGDVFVKDLVTGAITRVSTGPGGGQLVDGGYSPVFSPDATRIAFASSDASLAPDDTNFTADIFIKDLVTGAVTRVSTDSAGVGADGFSFDPVFSADGRRILFESIASNLGGGGNNGAIDLFVKDLDTGAVTCVSTDSAGNEANGSSDHGVFSPDGTLVAFASDAGNLVADDTNNVTDIFVKNLATGAITRVSTDSLGQQGDNYSVTPVFSPDGRYLAFGSAAGNLVEGDTNAVNDIFLKDLVTGAVLRISTSATGGPGNRYSAGPVFSGDGHWLAFESLASLVSGDDNGSFDVYVKELLSAPVDLGGIDTVEASVSHALGDHVENLLLTGTAAIDGTGNSLDNTMVGNDAANRIDGGDGNDAIYAYGGNDTLRGGNGGDLIDGDDGEDDLAGGADNDELDGGAGDDALAGEDGDDILVGGPGDDRASGGAGSDALDGDDGADTLAGGTGSDQLDGGAGDDSLSGGDGGDFLYGGGGTNTLSGGAGDDYYYIDGADDQVIEVPPGPPGNAIGNTGGVIRASTDDGGNEANRGSFSAFLSADGNRIVFSSDADNLVSDDTNLVSDIFLKDLTTGQVTRLSTGAGGAQANDFSDAPVLSADGGKLLFVSLASNLVADDTNNAQDIFVRDLASGVVTRVSTGADGTQADGDSFSPAVFSPDGLKVAFTSYAGNLVAGDSNGVPDVFVKDLVTGAITRVSTGAAGAQGNELSEGPVFSPDGGRVAFYSAASNLVAGDGNGVGDVFVKDLATGALTRVSTGAAGEEANQVSGNAEFSADGTKLLFASYASNLVDGDTNNAADIFLKDLVTGAVTRISTSATGAQGNADSFYQARFLDNGSKVAFISTASNLVGGDSNNTWDIFIKDLVTGAVTRVSTNQFGTQATGDNGSFGPVFSADSRRMAFVSYMNNLVFNDGNGLADVFVKDLTRLPPDPGGVDTVYSSVSHQLSEGVENLVLTGIDNAGTGNDLGNRISAFVGNNNLSGGGGDDVLDSHFGDDTLDGGAGDDLLMASDGFDRASGGTGNDRVFGGAGNDSLAGGAGNDMLVGDDDDDTLSGDDGDDGLNGGNGNDALDGGAGADELAGEAGNDTLGGGDGDDGLYAGDGDDVVAGGDGDDAIDGDAGNDTLSGGAGDDRFDGGTGDDLQIGAGGNDTYALNAGDGADTIVDDDAGAGSTDTLEVGAASDQIWFRQLGDDLEVRIIGGADAARIEDWFLGAGHRIERFEAGDGKVLADTQVDALVTAMAAFALPPAGSSTLPPAYQAALNPVLAANWT